ncbi:MAG: F0F1 ATP synthase subunit B [Psittacicella sp.]
MEINATIIAQTIAFIIFVWFCMKFIWPPINKAIEQRQKTIAQALADAQDAVNEKQRIDNLIKEELDKAKEQAQEIINNANKQYEIIINNMLEEGKKMQDQIIQDGYAQIEHESLRVKKELQESYASLVSLGVKKVTESESSNLEDSKLLDSLIDKL